MTPISFIPSIPKINGYIIFSENVQLQSRRLAPIQGSLPFRRHRFPGGMYKGTRAPKWRQFTPISGAEAQSIPLYTQDKWIIVKMFSSNRGAWRPYYIARKCATHAPLDSRGYGYLEGFFYRATPTVTRDIR